MKIGLLGALLAAAVCAATAVHAEEEKVLNIYNWSDYIGEDTVAKFEKATGIKVHYDVYDSNEVLEAKLLAGHSGYDIVVPSAVPYMARQIQAGVYRKIDKAKLSNYHNLDPRILQAAALADPGNAYGVPYLWGTTGIGYNIAKVRAVMGPDAPVNSLKLLFDPTSAAGLSNCGISVLDSAQELFPAALAYLGRNPMSRDPGDLQKAADVLMGIRASIRKIHSSQYIQDLANGDVCLVFGYSGDILQAKNRAHEARNGIDIAYSIPKEGAMIWVDMMGIPADAPHGDNALAFINFILEPQIGADIVNTVAYATPNTAAVPLVDKDLRADPSVFPPDDVRTRLFYDRPVPPAYERQRTRLWTKIKTGE